MPFNLNLQNEKYLAFIAAVLYLMWFADVFLKLAKGKIYGFFLFCSLSLLITCIVIINKNPTLLLVFLSASIITQSIWMTDLLVYVFLKKSIFNTVGYIFLLDYSKIEVITTIRHFFIIPLELFAFVFMKKLPKNFKKFVLYVSLSVLGFLIPSLFLGAKNNINYVYAPPFEVSAFLNIGVVYFFAYVFFLIISISLVGALILFLVKKYKKLFNYQKVKIYFWIVLILVFLLALKVSLVILKIKKDVPLF